MRISDWSSDVCSSDLLRLIVIFSCIAAFIWFERIDNIEPELSWHRQSMQPARGQQDRPVAEFDSGQALIIGNRIAFASRHGDRLRLALGRRYIAQHRAMAIVAEVELRLAVLVEEKHLEVAMRKIVDRKSTRL